MTFEELKADHARLTRALIEAGKEMERMSDTRQVDGGYVLSDAHPTAGHEVVTPEEVAALRADNARMREELETLRANVDEVFGGVGALASVANTARVARDAAARRVVRASGAEYAPAPAIIPPYPPEAAPQVSLPGPVCLRCHGAGTVVAAGNNTARPCDSCDGRGYDDGLTPDEREEMTALYPRGSGKAVKP